MQVLTLSADEWAIESGFELARRDDRARRLNEAWERMPYESRQGKDFGIGWMHELLKLNYLDG